MPVKCFYKPNRSSPRKFREQDLARIAENVHGSGVSWGAILGVIAVSGGFAYLLCKGVRLMDVAQQLGEFLNDLVDVAAVIGAISTAIAILRYGQGLPLAGRVVTLMITFLASSLVFLRRVADYQRDVKDIGSIERFKELLLEGCDAAETRIDYLLAIGKGDRISQDDLQTFRGDIPDG